MTDQLAEAAALRRERASALRQVEDAAKREAAARDVLLAAKAEWDADRFAMLDVLAEFVAIDGQECALDSTGECRPHAYPTAEAGMPCPYQRARDLLAAASPDLEQRQRAAEAEAHGQIERMLDDAGRLRRR